MEQPISSSQEYLYDCVQSLIAAEPRAKELYLSQGEQKQGDIILNAGKICSYAQLQNFLQNE